MVTCHPYDELFASLLLRSLVCVHATYGFGLLLDSATAK